MCRRYRIDSVDFVVSGVTVLVCLWAVWRCTEITNNDPVLWSTIAFILIAINTILDVVRTLGCRFRVRYRRFYTIFCILEIITAVFPLPLILADIYFIYGYGECCELVNIAQLHIILPCIALGSILGHSHLWIRKIFNAIIYLSLIYLGMETCNYYLFAIALLKFIVVNGGVFNCAVNKYFTVIFVILAMKALLAAMCENDGEFIPFLNTLNSSVKDFFNSFNYFGTSKCMNHYNKNRRLKYKNIILKCAPRPCFSPPPSQPCASPQPLKCPRQTVKQFDCDGYHIVSRHAGGKDNHVSDIMVSECDVATKNKCDNELSESKGCLKSEGIDSCLPFGEFLPYDCNSYDSKTKGRKKKKPTFIFKCF